MTPRRGWQVWIVASGTHGWPCLIGWLSVFYPGGSVKNAGWSLHTGSTLNPAGLWELSSGPALACDSPCVCLGAKGGTGRKRFANLWRLRAASLPERAVCPHCSFVLGLSLLSVSFLLLFSLQTQWEQEAWWGVGGFWYCGCRGSPVS